MKSVLLLIVLILSTGCTYHYSLVINAAPTPSLQPDTNPAPRSFIDPKEAGDPMVEGKANKKPMSISPGDFQANQSQGGTMVNVLIKLILSLLVTMLVTILILFCRIEHWKVKAKR